MGKLTELFKTMIDNASKIGKMGLFSGEKFKFHLTSTAKQEDYTTQTRPSKRRTRRARGKANKSKVNHLTEFNGDFAPTGPIYNKVPKDWCGCHKSKTEFDDCDHKICFDCVAFENNKNHKKFMTYLGLV